MHALLVLGGIPLLCIVLLALAVYLPSIVRGESVAPAGARADDEWFGGRRDAEKALEQRQPERHRRDGWGQWQLVTSPPASGSRSTARSARPRRPAATSSRCSSAGHRSGPTGRPRDYAVGLHAALVAPSHSVLVMVDPVARVVEVVTGSVVKRTLTDHEVQLAILEMQTAFAAGDLVGGLKRGITMLADHARAPQTLHAE